MGNNSLGDERRRQMDMRIRARDRLVRSKGFNPRREFLEEAKKKEAEGEIKVLLLRIFLVVMLVSRLKTKIVKVTVSVSG